MKRDFLPEQKDIENSVFLSEKMCRLDEQISVLNTENANLNTENANLNTENANLKEQLNWLKRQVFGKRSERNVADVNADQMECEVFFGLKRIEEKK